MRSLSLSPDVEFGTWARNYFPHAPNPEVPHKNPNCAISCVIECSKPGHSTGISWLFSVSEEPGSPGRVAIGVLVSSLNNALVLSEPGSQLEQEFWLLHTFYIYWSLQWWSPLCSWEPFMLQQFLYSLCLQWSLPQVRGLQRINCTLCKKSEEYLRPLYINNDSLKLNGQFFCWKHFKRQHLEKLHSQEASIITIPDLR